MHCTRATVATLATPVRIFTGCILSPFKRHFTIESPERKAGDSDAPRGASEQGISHHGGRRIRWGLSAGRLACLALVALVAITPVIGPSDGAFASNPGVRGDAHFGINWINPPQQVATGQRMQQAVDLGARWDRFPFYWHEIQPTQGGGFDFSYLDRAVNNDIANGFQVQGILLGAPQWAVASGHISMDDWRRYVTETVKHFKGRVSYWEIWNEPDLLGPDGKGMFWYWSVPDYYFLLKNGYQAVKAADPNAKVIMGSLAFPHNNQEFFPIFLQELAKDPTAAGNNQYFDILSLHLYGKAGTLYDLPIGYVGSPDFAGFHNLMKSYGFDKPIWVNEAGVGVYDTGTGIEGPGRATMSEHASYMIQAYAYGLAGGIDKIFAFQLYDDGAGANDASGNKAEYYGLISNAGEPRPAYAAYQTAAKYFSNAQLVTRVNLNRSGAPDVKGLDIITMYGTPNGKVTVVWNNDGGPNERVRLIADTAQATRVDKLGRQQAISAANGVYDIALAPATNNNNFGCYTSSGCQPNDFIIGGDPVILVEPDSRVPAATVKPLPSGVESPFTVTWGTTQSASGAVTYDVQYMDAADGVWRNWLTKTTATHAQFGTGTTFTQLNHTYLFRVRARDAAGNLLGGSNYPSNAMASTVVLRGNVVDGGTHLPAGEQSVGASELVDAKIQIVWPQGNLPVSQATKANIGAYLFGHGTTTSLNAAFDRPVKLYRALDAGVEEEVAVGTKTSVTRGDVTFPVWEFNDVDVSAARNAAHKYFFRVAPEGTASVGNIWAHGSDARTIFPQMDVPTGVLETPPAIVDGKVEIVWPHGNLPVSQATKANIGVYLFGHGTMESVPASYDRPVKLLRTLNNGVEQVIGVGVKTMKTENGITFPTWQFNDVDVSAARDGSSQYYFRVSVEGVKTYSNVWSHGKDARTNFPRMDVPTGVMP